MFRYGNNSGHFFGDGFGAGGGVEPGRVNVCGLRDSAPQVKISVTNFAAGDAWKGGTA